MASPAGAEVAAPCRAVSREFATLSGSVAALREIDLDVAPAAVTVIGGPSGSGKSSLLRLLAAVDRPDAGTVEVAGVDVGRLRGRARRRLRADAISYVFQAPVDNLIADLTVRQQLDLAARLRGTRVSAGDLDRLARLGLGERLEHRPAQLSGGEQQRAALAAAVVGAPALVVADEPTAELDRGSGAAVIAALRDLAASGAGVVVAAHDPAVLDAADAVVRLEHGRRVA